MRALTSRIVFALAALLPAAAHAGAFGVSPIRLDFDRNTRTGLVTVANDDERRLYFQLKLYVWTQTPEGEDQYAESADLVFFPQIMTVEPKERRLVRVGVKGAPAGPERAYRLFIEEMPDPGDTLTGGAQIAVRLRFGVPIFVAPAEKAAPLPEIVAADAAKGAVLVRIRNTGDRQIRFEEVVARSGDRTVGKAAGWYVFPGATRTFSIPIDKEGCPSGGDIEVRATGEGKDVRKALPASPLLCQG